MNPLTELCAQVSRAGYTGDREISARLHNDDVLNLGKFLLNHPQQDVPVRLQWAPDESDSIAIGFGSGIDSYCALLHAIGRYKTIHLVHVNYGQPYLTAERQVFKALLDALCYGENLSCPAQTAFSRDLERCRANKKNSALFFWPKEIPLVPVVQEKTLDWAWKDYIVPARNLVLASACAEYSNRVWIVATSRNNETVGAPDKTSKFYRQASAIFSAHYRRPCEVTSPFLNASKLQVVQGTLEKFDNLEALKCTFSCYTPTPENQHCGTCYACYKRYKLFQKLNTEFNFAVHPQSAPNFSKYEDAEQRKRG